jgi:hypothetical protein
LRHMSTEELGRLSRKASTTGIMFETLSLSLFLSRNHTSLTSFLSLRRLLSKLMFSKSNERSSADSGTGNDHEPAESLQNNRVAVPGEGARGLKPGEAGRGLNFDRTGSAGVSMSYTCRSVD